jgi:hypothetical protein
LRRAGSGRDLLVVEAVLPLRAAGLEAVEVLLAHVVERDLPAVLVGVQLLRERLEAFDPRLQLGERARAEGSVDLTDAVEEADLGLPPRAVLPRDRQKRVDGLFEGGLVARRLAATRLEIEVRGAHRNVGRRVRDEDRRGRRRRLWRLIMSDEGAAPDAFLVTPSGEAVGLSRSRVVGWAADVAPRLRLLGRHGVRERAR